MSAASVPKASIPALVKPTLRGESHQYAACLAMPAGFLLTYLAPSSRAALGAFVYTLSLVTLFGISACYHIPTWEPRQRKWMRRLDHAAIFLLIAGTYTPICLIALPGQAGQDLLRKIWTGAIAGIGQSLFWITAPKTLVTGLYVLLGWAGIRSIGQLQDTNTLLMAAGGMSYTIGGMHGFSVSFRKQVKCTVHCYCGRKCHARHTTYLRSPVTNAASQALLTIVL